MSASAIGLERVARWGGLALLGVTFGASAMLLRPDQAPLAPGFADEGRRSVAPVERGRLAQLDVEPGDLVHAGAVLARLDPAVLEREIEAREAEADAAASRARSRADRAVRSLDDARARLAEARGDASRARALVASLTRAVDEQEALVRRGIDGGGQLVSLRADLAEAGADARAADALVASLASAAEREAPDVEAAAKLEVDAVRREVDVLRARRAELDLRSPIEGRVAAVWRRPGDAVEPGDAALDVVPLRAERATACVDARVARTLVPGQPALIEDLSGLGEARARVVAVGPNWQEADPRCRLTLYQPGWIVPVALILDAGEDLAPGAPVAVRWLPPEDVPLAQGMRSPRQVP